MSSVLFDAILITTKDEIQAIKTDGTLESLRTAVGGYIEMLRFSYLPVHMYLNEEGKLKNLPPNVAASIVAWGFCELPITDAIVGDVIILGDGPNGEEASCPKPLVRALLKAADQTLTEQDIDAVVEEMSDEP